MMNTVLGIIFAVLFALGIAIYSLAQKSLYSYRFDNWLYKIIYKHDSELSVVGVCMIVIFGTAIMIWLLLNI